MTRMDLYDLSNYFATMVPVEASHCPLLKHAACAIAAKQLGLVKGRKATIGGVCSIPATTALFSDSENTDWSYVAAKYYDKAITCLQKALVKNISRHCLYTSSCGSDDREEQKRRRLGMNIDCSPAVDGLLAGTTILSVYEFMDGSNLEWSRCELMTVLSILNSNNSVQAFEWTEIIARCSRCQRHAATQQNHQSSTSYVLDFRSVRLCRCIYQPYQNLIEYQ